MRKVAKLPACLVGMEACWGVHPLGTRVQPARARDTTDGAAVRQGLCARATKNDYQDAEAIGEAVGCANMRFVAVKTVEQQDLQAMHRIRPAAV